MSKSLIEMAEQLEAKGVESGVSSDAPVETATAVADPSPYAAWLAEGTRNAQVLEHLLAREDAAGGSGGAGNEFVDSLLRYLRKHDRLTDKQRDAVLKGLAKMGAKSSAKPQKASHVSNGFYAIDGDDGDTVFYRVQHGKPGTRWDGFVFVDRQASDDFYPVRAREQKAAVLKGIEEQGVLESLVRYGHELGVCGVCHKTLTDPPSIADGIGPVCKSNLGG